MPPKNGARRYKNPRRAPMKSQNFWAKFSSKVLHKPYKIYSFAEKTPIVPPYAEIPFLC
jgi:hypothetical protein